MKSYLLHPETIRHFKNGHPWVTRDKFSLQFPSKASIILAKDKKNNILGSFLNDPEHPMVKARFWSTEEVTPEQFRKQIKERFASALKKRLDQDWSSERENLYLVFGESDDLPGILLQTLNGNLILQLHCLFWLGHLDYLSKVIWTSYQEVFGKEAVSLWAQGRNWQRDGGWKHLRGSEEETFIVKEFGINYEIRLNKHYDFGLYTDMASLRKRVARWMKPGSSFLNLFCYTGAYSLIAMEKGCDKVVSCDLSGPYLNWLDKNLELNPHLDKEKHVRLETSVKKGLAKQQESGETFDLILSDPPSSSSDGKKRTSAYANYKNDLPAMSELLTPGGKLVLFLNTHSITQNKFKSHILGLIEEYKLPLKFQENLKMHEDCATLKGFPEGSYLKGLVFFRP